MSNIGKSGDSGGVKRSKDEAAAVRPSGQIPAESAIKKFEDTYKDERRRQEKTAEDRKKEAGGIFDLRKGEGTAQPKQPAPPHAVHQAVQAALDKLRKEEQKKGEEKEMRISKEGKSVSKGDLEEKSLQELISGKTQPVEEKLEGNAEGGEKKEGVMDEAAKGAEVEEKITIELKSDKEGEGQFKIKVDKGPEIPSAFLEPVQPAVKGPLGQSLEKADVAQATQSEAVKAMADLASTTLSKMQVLVSGTEATPGNVVRISNLADVNTNLQNVDIVIKKEGGRLNVEFLTPNTDIGNYILNNKEGLNAVLRNGLAVKDVADIRIDITQKTPDTHKDDSQGRSRGQREQKEPEPLEEEE